MNLPLHSFRLQNFKAVRNSGMVTFGPLTVFIGNNGSGKSSLIEGLETFRDIVLDGLDSAMSRWRGFEHVWNHSAPHVLRRSPRSRTQHTNPLTFLMTGHADSAKYGATMRVNLGEGGNELFLQQEQIKRSGRGFSLQQVRDSQGAVFSQGHSQSTSITSSDVTSTRSSSTSSSTSRSTSRAGDDRLADGQSCLKSSLGEFLERWQFLSLVPDDMGQPVPQQRAAGHVRLAKNGANVAEYLNEIRKLDVEAFNGLLDSLRYVLPYAADLQPLLTSELERAFYLKLREKDFEVPGWLLSTGTLRIAALLACLRHPKPPPLLVVEEIENGLDPRTLHLVVEELRATIASGKTQVILTTHSPYLLDLLDLSHIVVVEREDGQPVFRRPDVKQLADWAKSFSPGRLYTMGRLTRGDQ